MVKIIKETTYTEPIFNYYHDYLDIFQLIVHLTLIWSVLNFFFLILLYFRVKFISFVTFFIAYLLLFLLTDFFLFHFNISITFLPNFHILQNFFDFLKENLHLNIPYNFLSKDTQLNLQYLCANFNLLHTLSNLVVNAILRQIIIFPILCLIVYYIIKLKK